MDRIGIINPYDFALDRELWRWTPPGASLHMTRLPLGEAAVTIDMVEGLGTAAELATATGSLTTVGPAVVAYACTSGSFVNGLTGEARLRGIITAAGARDAVTTSGALLEALDALGVARVALATPYTRDLTERLERLLAETGRTTVAVADLGLRERIWELSRAEVADLVRRADRPDAGAIVISCTNVPTYDLLARLEAERGKPIISANQATMWAALRRIGRSAVGDGQRLLGAV